MDYECSGFTFIHNFDSGNLGQVDFVGEYSQNEPEDHYYEFNLWTRQDNEGTIYENGNRTWFYFGVRGGPVNVMVKFNVQMNKQSKMYSQGMTPVFKTLPGRGSWERIREKPSFSVNRSKANLGKFSLTFKHRLQDNDKVTTFFAFTYPFTYTELQSFLNTLDLMVVPNKHGNEKRLDDIYYHRELLCYTVEGLRVDLLTISSHHNISREREPRFEHLFPDKNTPRAFKFDRNSWIHSSPIVRFPIRIRRKFIKPHCKKVVFLSARVHPGETPSSFVMNGAMMFLTSKDDPIAIALRKHFVFKIIPMLNPDGVFCGNYRTDTRGVNLNRVYLNPSPVEHPSIYGARKLILYYHHGKEIVETYTTNEDAELKNPACENKKVSNLEDGVSDLQLRPKNENDPESRVENENPPPVVNVEPEKVPKEEENHKKDTDNSGLFLYIDMHGHASKKGIFMYGNHFGNICDYVECMLFPKLVSLNSQHFHFDSCNFSERNMYLKDKKDGSSREGAGRVAILKSTGLIRSYTLECNYNTGKMVNAIAPPLREALDKRPLPILLSPPKYTPNVFEEVGRSIMSSILDLNGCHPNSRLTNTTHRTLNGVREFLRQQILAELTISNLTPKTSKVKSEPRMSRSSSRSETSTRPRRGKGVASNIGSSTVGGVVPSVKCNRSTGNVNPHVSSSTGEPGVMPKKRSKRPESPSALMTSSRRSIPRLEKKETRRLQVDQRRKKLKPK